MIKQSVKSQVKILPGLFRERMDTNRNYLLELDSTCLLQNFYLEAGIIMPDLQVIENPAEAKLHWGWEAPTCQLRGHFLGHWLSASASLIASENDTELKVKLDKIISEMGKCQKLNGGEWIGSIPEKYFHKLCDGDYIWSPQYVMHKTIMGLFHAYIYAKNEQALEICDKLSDWYIRWTDEMIKKAPYAVYSGEAGGMLEIWAWLYEVTKAEKYLTLANRYKDDGMLKSLAEGKDALTNCHANASIPLSHGACKMYEITGDNKWRKIAESFWQNAVETRGYYCTGGMNSGEFWVPPHMQGKFLGDTNQEFCTVYNMVRLADYLFKWTGDKKYLDYIERCLYNGFLAQQNQNTGTPTYFLPLGENSHKKWGTKRHDFWCCHGTMVQAHTLYPQLVYYVDESTDKVIVSQYISSTIKVELSTNSFEITQTMGMKYYNDQAFFDEHDDSLMSRWAFDFKIKADSDKGFTLSLRIPYWEKSTPNVTINGSTVNTPNIQNGYINIENCKNGDTISVHFHNGLTMEKLPDIPELSAVCDGPIVLAGLSDDDCGLVGDFKNPNEFLKTQTEHTYGTFPWKQSCYRTRNQPKNFIFKPLYDITDETYTVYFTEK